MKRNLIFCWLILITLWVRPASAQEYSNVYEYKPALNISLGAAIVGVGTTAFILQKKKEPLTFEQIDQLAYTDINRFDRSAARRPWNERINLASDAGMLFAMVTPAFLLIDRNVRREAKVIIPMYVQTMASTFALTALTKESVRRTRPYVYNPDVPMEYKVKKDATSSFFSGHTSMTASGAFFTAKVYADMNPDSRWKPAVWTGAAVLPLAVGLLRYGGGKHFFTDILTGYAVGAAVGILVPHLHRTALRP